MPQGARVFGGLLAAVGLRTQHIIFDALQRTVQEGETKVEATVVEHHDGFPTGKVTQVEWRDRFYGRLGLCPGLDRGTRGRDRTHGLGDKCESRLEPRLRGSGSLRARGHDPTARGCVDAGCPTWVRIRRAGTARLIRDSGERLNRENGPGTVTPVCDGWPGYAFLPPVAATSR